MRQQKSSAKKIKKANEKPWYLHQLSYNELVEFVEEAKKSKSNINAFVGTVTDEAAQRIKAVCGINVNKIMLDSGAIRHAYSKKYHMLENDDILHYIDVVNTVEDIQLSEKKHLMNDVLTFTKEINGKILFATEVRIHYGGWLSLITCYRLHKKK